MANLIRMFLFFSAVCMLGFVAINRIDLSGFESALVGLGSGVLAMAFFETYMNIRFIAKNTVKLPERRRPHEGADDYWERWQREGKERWRDNE